MAYNNNKDVNSMLNDNSLDAYSIPNMYQYVSAYPLPIRNYRMQAGIPKTSTKKATNILYGYGVNSFNRFELMMELVQHLEGDRIDRIRFLKENWSACDHQDHKSMTLASSIEEETIFGSPVSFREFLTHEEFQWINGLGKTFRIYRGCDESVIAGASWTTNHKVADSFARGLRGCTHDTPVIVSATCDMGDVLLAIDDREEKEIIINPKNLSDVLVTPFHMQIPALDLVTSS